ncbi:MAG: hypothetical protein US95_C0026G0005 [Candidatus Woesebacteria bacterium GW2011_GWB1_38_5]|uniref:DNA 3'-5' helicase n=2 Tax=Candidatus Woeseibacteriota TaxID=1752722 RepID=A0A0G0KFY0_9BACT|nr:MAG: hypothetical protein US95_C0026G0005 [Candidatus Woesebacteria bacterium GW2011_GWB1_38_5]
MASIKKLNEEQLRAVKHKNGPLMIIAGAGTGKTTVITERVKYLIEKKLATPPEILALTFTEKAAAEMQERIDVALPLGYTQMWISTFHAFCDRILKNEALQIGLNPKYKLNTQSESIQFFRKNLFKFELEYFRPLGNPTKFIDGMLQHFSRLQDEDVKPSEYLAWVNPKSEIRNPKREKSKSVTRNPLTEEQTIELQKWQELARAYKMYDELKTKEGVMDFGDLIVKTLELFRKRPNVLKEYQKKFKYILVDEFQDTNISQNELVKLLAGKEGNITVVLDDDQSIYRFRGAAVSNALYFRKFYPKAKVITLVNNYRSDQEILDRAYSLIQFNNPDRLEVVEKINKKLISQVKYPDTVDERIEFIHSDRVENEAEVVAKEIETLTANPPSRKASEGLALYNYKDISILVRANNHAEPFMRALSRYGTPYQFLGPGRLFKQTEIVDLISYMKVLYDFDDSISMYKLLSIEYFEIPPRDLIKITNYARQKNLSLFEVSETVTDVSVSDDTKDKIGKIIKIISEQQKQINKETAGQLLYNFLNETGLILKLLSPDTPLAERRAKNISKFFDKLKTYEVEHEDASVRAVVDWIDLASELGESPLAADTDWTDINAVNILTIHSSKGLEFPVVFLVNLVSQRFPTNERREQIPIPEELIKEVLPQGDYHIQEERRLFYVGMTRAKERLYLTAADYYGEGKREKKISPFVYEAMGDKFADIKETTDDSKQLSFLEYKPTVDSRPLAASEKIHVDFLSYSQIETFKICPLHYKLKYIYKLPTPPSSSQSFGNSFHQVMKEFYDVVKKGEKPNLDLMYKILEGKWISDGYTSKAHETRSYEKIKKFLKHYLENLFDPKVLPIQTEQPFTVIMDNLKVGGKIDRVDHNGNGIHIIDYKTGANPITQKEADSDLQLSIYALAATHIPEYPFNRKPEDIKLSLYYFDTPQIVTTLRTKEQLENAKKQILDYKKQIEESDFKCSHGYLCVEMECEYKLFCRAEEK